MKASHDEDAVEEDEAAVAEDDEDAVAEEDEDAVDEEDEEDEDVVEEDEDDMIEEEDVDDVDEEDEDFDDDDDEFDPVLRSFHEAIEEGRVDEVARMLLEHEIPVNGGDGGEAPFVAPLHMACYWGHVDIAQLLIEQGADIDQTTGEGSTPLSIAVGHGNVDVAHLLIERGADVIQATDDGRSPLFQACERLQHDDEMAVVARLLIERGADVSQARDDGGSPLLMACWHSNVNIVRLLLRGGADIHRAVTSAPNHPDIVGMTPLSLAREFRAVGDTRSAADLIIKAAQPWTPETHALRSAAARARAVDLVRVGHLLSTSGASLNPGIRTWLRSRVGRTFWLRVMSYIDMGVRVE